MTTIDGGWSVKRARLAGGVSTHLTPVPHSQWEHHAPEGLREVWLSRKFLVQVYAAPLPALARLTVCRTKAGFRSWKEGITWSELQQLKRECGRGSQWAVEIFPAEGCVVNVANMRHLWILLDPPSFGWNVPAGGDRGL